MLLCCLINNGRQEDWGSEANPADETEMTTTGLKAVATSHLFNGFDEVNRLCTLCELDIGEDKKGANLWPSVWRDLITWLSVCLSL